MDGGIWSLQPPLLRAQGISHEIERPHVVVHGSRYYLFFSAQRHTFHPPQAAPTGLYGFVARDLAGPWEPLNGSGLVIRNPPNAPDQAYAWLVLPDLRAVSFLNYRSPAGGDLRRAPAEEARAGFGGTLAPTLQLALDGSVTSIVKQQGGEPAMTLRRRLFAIPAALAMLVCAAVFLLPQSEARRPAAGILSITPITEVYTYGQKVSAVAIEYAEPVNAGRLDRSTFRVRDSIYDFRLNPIEDLPKLEDRTVTDVYTSRSPAKRHGAAVPLPAASGYDPERRYPLMIVLPGHGMGWDGDDNTGRDRARSPEPARRRCRGGRPAARAPRPVHAGLRRRSLADLRDDGVVRVPDAVAHVRQAPRAVRRRPVTGGFRVSDAQAAAIAAGEVPLWVTHGVNDHLLNISLARGTHAALRSAYEARGKSAGEIARLLHYTEYEKARSRCSTITPLRAHVRGSVDPPGLLDQRN